MSLNRLEVIKIGKVRDFFKNFAINEAFSKVEETNTKGFEFTSNFPQGNIFYLGQDNKQVPILENVYNVFASQMSLLEVKHYSIDDKNITTNYNVKNSAILRCFGYEINEKQTSTDFLHAFFYNVIKFGNGIAVIDPYYNGQFNPLLKKKMELKMYNLDVSSCEFGHAYVEDNETLYLVVRYKKTKEIDFIPYSMIVHLRYKSQQIFDNEKADNSMNDIVKLYDTALKEKLKQLAGENGDKVIFKMRMSGQASELQKEVKRESVIENFTRSKAVVIDSDEAIEKLSLTNFTYDKDAIDDITRNIYNFFGVNENVVKGDYTEQQFSSFYNNTIEPQAQKFQEELQRKLIPKSDFINGERLEVTKARIIATISQFINSFDKLVYHGVMSPNDLRRIMGLDPIEGGDKYYTNANAVEIGATTQNDQVQKTLKGGD